MARCRLLEDGDVACCAELPLLEELNLSGTQ
jgi:hypothetical protein